LALLKTSGEILLKDLRIALESAGVWLFGRGYIPDNSSGIIGSVETL
jgi:hypothetical protein